MSEREWECPFCKASEKQQFDLKAVADSPNDGYAYNLFQCECDAICKKNVWKNAGELWIHPLTDEIIKKKKP